MSSEREIFENRRKKARERNRRRSMRRQLNYYAVEGRSEEDEE